MPKPRVFVDTSAWFAYVNAKDPQHEAVAESLDGFRGRLVTTDYIFDETVTLSRRRLGHSIAMRIGSVLLDPITVEMIRVGPGDTLAAWRLFSERADQVYSFTDCTSFVVMRRLGLKKAVAVDDDFKHEGFEVMPSQ